MKPAKGGEQRLDFSFVRNTITKGCLSKEKTTGGLCDMTENKTKKSKWVKLAIVIIISGMIGGGSLAFETTGNGEGDEKGEIIIEYTMNDSIEKNTFWVNEL